MPSSPSFWNPVLTVRRKQPLQWGLIYLNGNFHCMDTNPMGNWHWIVCLYMFPLMPSHCVRQILFLSFLEFQGRSISLYMFLRCSIWSQALPAPGDQAFTIKGFQNTLLPCSLEVCDILPYLRYKLNRKEKQSGKQLTLSPPCLSWDHIFPTCFSP